MSISITRYVNITSGVGGVGSVTQRNLVGRFFTTNTLIPPQTYVSFTTAAAVGDYFGIASEEYLRAAFYFSFISKNITSPQSIQFARWTPTAVAPRVQSSLSNVPVALATWAGITDGSLGITIGSVVGVFSGIDFTAAPPASYADVATIIQTAIRTNADANFATATVTYIANVGFVFAGGVTGDATISIQAGSTGTDLTAFGYLGWLPAASFDSNGNYTAGAVASSGSDAETVTQALDASANVSNNFGSFLFLNNTGYTLADAILAAQWANTPENNNTYMFCAPVTSTNYAAWVSDSSGLGTYAGTALTLSGATLSLTGTVTSGSDVITGLGSVTGLALGVVVNGAGIPAGSYITSINAVTSSIVISAQATASSTQVLSFVLSQFPEQIPMMILAATNYSLPNSTQNYMFQGPFAGLTPLVTSDSAANTYDNVSVNYYGSTQQAGNIINFYQTGVLQGTNTTPNDMTTYTNEMWLKDAITVAIMNLFIGLPQIPANQSGRSILLTGIQEPINQAINNGTISVNKALSQTQKQFIFSVTNDPNAWFQVQNAGYWLDCQITQSGTTYTAHYTLVYSKDDVIRLVTGQDILI